MFDLSQIIAMMKQWQNKTARDVQYDHTQNSDIQFVVLNNGQ